jgi:hypothetical protein
METIGIHERERLPITLRAPKTLRITCLLNERRVREHEAALQWQACQRMEERALPEH